MGDGPTVTLADEAATRRFGETLALALRPGDCVWLVGDLGAGKSALARATLRAAAADDHLEVPSPTFTLVQSYDDLSFGTALHADLYRLEAPEEVEELGLTEALESGVVMIEWPERGGGTVPPATLQLTIEVAAAETRHVTATGSADALARLHRSIAIRRFLDVHGHDGSARRPLTGDASTRSYETLHDSGAPDERPPILMNAPAQPDGPPIRDGLPYSRIAHLAEDVTAFVAVVERLREAGFRAPKIGARDLDHGLLVLDNLGSDSPLDGDRRPLEERYLASVETLAALHAVPLDHWTRRRELEPGHVHTVPPYDAGAMAIEVALLPDWYLPHRLGRPLEEGERAGFEAVWAPLIADMATRRETLVLRDFHSPNIIWDGGREGTDRTGLIDVQDALIGPAAYDVTSLAHDARVDMPPDLSARLIDRYIELRKGAIDEDDFRRSLAIMQAQRATKVAGIFVRLSKRDGKHGYIAHLPRMERVLADALAHPALADYRSWLDDILRD